MTWKAAALLFLVVSLCSLTALLVVLHLQHKSEQNSAAVLSEVRRLNQLITVRYSIQRVIGMREARTPIGQESILLEVQGQALAGVDLSALDARDVGYLSRQSLRIILPPAKLLTIFIEEDKTRVWDHSITWWTPWVPYDPELEHRARLMALDEIRSAAIQMGIIQTAQRNAETAIRDFLRALSLQVTFTPST